MTEYKGMTGEELNAFLAEAGEKPYRAAQLFDWLHVRGIRLQLKGFCIDYCGYTGAAGHALAAAAGPLAGLAYALAASGLAQRLESDWLGLTAGISLLLSLFNLVVVGEGLVGLYAHPGIIVCFQPQI